MSQPPQFRETQRMGQPSLWVVSVLTTLPAFVVNVVVGVVVVLIVTAFLYSIRLITEVRPDGIYVRFAPIHRSFRRLPFDQIERVERTEFGLLTYGGIGIRWTPDALAYMTTLGTGIEITRTNAKSVVIGSQRTTELLQAIDRLY